jgi:uncharacterized protein (TIGR02453 family)
MSFSSPAPPLVEGGAAEVVGLVVGLVVEEALGAVLDVVVGARVVAVEPAAVVGAPVPLVEVEPPRANTSASSCPHAAMTIAAAPNPAERARNARRETAANREPGGPNEGVASAGSSCSSLIGGHARGQLCESAVDQPTLRYEHPYLGRRIRGPLGTPTGWSRVREHLRMATSFHGWPAEAFAFYRDLEADNTKTFWQAHKAIYDEDVKAPFEAFSELVAEEFGPLRIFRPYRDVRFSKDKTPYKTRCYGVTEGETGEAYYLELNGHGMVSASGYWMMAKDQLERYRAAVDDARTGAALQKAVAAVEKAKLRIEGHALKTAPRGWPRDHPRIELLRHKSLAAMRSFDEAAWMGTKGALVRLTDVWRAGQPLNDWLGEHVGPSTEPPTHEW